MSRLNEYVKMHGDPQSKTHPQKGRCTGVYLIYLAGQERRDAMSRQTTAGKRDADIVNSYRRSKWSIRKERQVLDELNRQGLKPARGNEWFQVKDNGNKLKRLIELSTGDATKERHVKDLQEREESITLRQDDAVETVEGKIRGQLKSNAGVYFYKLKWNRPQKEALTPKQKRAGKKPKLTPFTYENLKTIYKERAKRNRLSKGMGDNIIRLVHEYINKNNVSDVFYDEKRHPDFKRRKNA